MSATSTSRVLHVINNPDVAGQACNFQQHAVYFPTFNNGTTPTYANLNLFEVPNSVCDSLDVGSDEISIKNEELKIMPNPNKEIYNDVTKSVKDNAGFCPCELLKNII